MPDATAEPPPDPAPPADQFAALRVAMPVTENYAYFDHAAVAPLPAPAAAAMSDYAASFRDHGDVHWPKWRGRVEACRAGLTSLLNASEDEVAVIRNTTEAIGLVAEGLDWREGDNVVVPASEFPSNLLPWRNLMSRGVEVREVPAEHERLDPAAVRDACDGRTRLVAASWVGYATGWRNDPADLCAVAHDAGALFLLDAIQGLGVLPLDVREVPVDFLCADGHKWLLGPEGAGVLYVRGDRLGDLRPLLVGWNSVAEAGNYGAATLTLKESAARYEGGTYATACAAGLAASLDLLADLPVGARHARLHELTALLCDGLRSAGCAIASDRTPGRTSGIVAFAPAGRKLRGVREAAAGGRRGRPRAARPSPGGAATFIRTRERWTGWWGDFREPDAQARWVTLMIRFDRRTAVRVTRLACASGSHGATATHTRSPAATPRPSAAATRSPPSSRANRSARTGPTRPAPPA